jgi:hypothetical protein
MKFFLPEKQKGTVIVNLNYNYYLYRNFKTDFYGNRYTNSKRAYNASYRKDFRQA